MASLPFVLRRPWLLAQNILADRADPDLDVLRRITDPERFLWSILPHAARTFSACIALLPASSAKASAVAYLYCRMLDTYEDLVPGRVQRQEALETFAARFDQMAADGNLPPAPPLNAISVDAADRAHVLLVERCELVDRVHKGLDPAVRSIIRDLVVDMAEGMVWGSNTFEDQGGALADEEQLLRYCRAVLGNPVVFVARISMLAREGRAELTEEEQRCAMRSGEFVQLANVTRDVEKDLARGVTYHPTLAGDLGRKLTRPRARFAKGGTDRAAALSERDAPDDHDSALVERARLARADFLRLALERADDYGRLVSLLDNCLTRASTVLMLLFTDRHYRGTAVRVGLAPWGQRPSSLSLIATALPAMVSRAWTRRVVRPRVMAMTAACAQLPPPSERDPIPVRPPMPDPVQDPVQDRMQDRAQATAPAPADSLETRDDAPAAEPRTV